MAPLRHSMPEKVEEVQAKVKAVFGYSPCLWQIEVARNVMAGKDVITIAPTGAGKSLTYWIPLVFSETGMVMVVLPLKQLGTQFSTMLKDRGISAVSVTAENSTNALCFLYGANSGFDSLSQFYYLKPVDVHGNACDPVPHLILILFI
ncbi:hypothetical protein IW262DRAFT_1490596 [Armillaria fumosa]|nr:hypothetical protein IW262DRAFT_1490596 [Armillaria fumosa]